MYWHCLVIYQVYGRDGYLDAAGQWTRHGNTNLGERDSCADEDADMELSQDPRVDDVTRASRVKLVECIKESRYQD